MRDDPKPKAPAPQETPLQRAMRWLDDHALSGCSEAALLAEYIRRERAK